MALYRYDVVYIHGVYRPSLFKYGGMLTSSILHGVVRFNIKNIRLENDKVRKYVDLCAFS